MGPKLDSMRSGLALSILLWLPMSYARSAGWVITQAGIVEGTATVDGLDRMYKGIPYAALPVGPLRCSLNRAHVLARAPGNEGDRGVIRVA